MKILLHNGPRHGETLEVARLLSFIEISIIPKIDVRARDLSKVTEKITAKIAVYIQGKNNPYYYYHQDSK